MKTGVPSGSANSRYVQALYEFLVHRAGGAAEVAGWVGALPAAGRQGAALGFLDSGEFRTDELEAYCNALSPASISSPARSSSATVDAPMQQGASAGCERPGFTE
jgi:hypothetical protein